MSTEDREYSDNSAEVSGVSRNVDQDKAVRTGEQPFRPRARLIRTLGRELITNEFIAIQELVKNAYDADATVVTLTFEEPLEPTKGSLVVFDNGAGMTLEELQSGWM